jgi:hypothetical protein
MLAVAFAVLAIYFLAFEGVSVERPLPEATTGPTILACPDGGVTKLRVRGPGGIVVADRSGSEWRLTPSPELGLPATLAVESLVSSLCDLPVIDTIPEPESLGDFGLDHPTVEVETAAGDWRSVLVLGDLTPAQNLLYAKRSDERRVLKVGALLRSEVEKVLAFARPAAPS